MNKVKNIIVHCSDSTFGNVNTIRQWHLEKGWRDIGYHFVILNGQLNPRFYLDSLDGAIECGRILDEDSYISMNEVGAHTLGYNKNSIGVCMIGKDSFTDRQMIQTVLLITDLIRKFDISIENVLGHCETDFGKHKTCPNIDMNELRIELVKRLLVSRET